MAGSGIRLMKMFVGDTPSVTEFLADAVPEGGTVGFDGRVLAMGEGQEFEEVLSAKNIKIDYSEDLIDQIWEDRPPLSEKPAFSWKKNIPARALNQSLSVCVKK